VDESLKYKIGLTLIPGIGDILAKNLIDYCGTAEAVFREKKAGLEKINGIGPILADAVHNHHVLGRAEEEINFIRRFNITPLYYLDEHYPHRLKQCSDAPVMLYYKGKADLNAKRIVNIVGTRNASEYGKKLCKDLVRDLADSGAIVVSGLAYGIDICAHKAALAAGTPTIGILAHGLDTIYPYLHRATAESMLEKGGLLTEFLSKTEPIAANFPKRNRIIAGLADATIVVESRGKGGSLITADIANSYSRDVFAFPGKVSDVCSVGCNQLIKYNKAALIESAADILRIMSWENQKKKPMPVQQKSLFYNLSPEEEVVMALLKVKTQMGMDELCISAKCSMSILSLSILNLELQGLVKSLPGKMYMLD
jgi:DNA processing protein